MLFHVVQLFLKRVELLRSLLDAFFKLAERAQVFLPLLARLADVSKVAAVRAHQRDLLAAHRQLNGQECACRNIDVLDRTFRAAAAAKTSHCFLISN